MKDERSKTIALVAAIVVVFACGAMRLRGATASQVAPKVDTSLVTEPAPANSPAAKNPSDNDDVVVQRTFPTPVEEPFRSYEPKGGLPKIPEKTAPPVLGGNIGGPLPPVNGAQPMNPMGTMAAAQPILHLSGVMPGRNGVAVIEFGNESHVVRAGERFGAGYTLESISRQTVKVRNGGKSLELSLDD